MNLQFFRNTLMVMAACCMMLLSSATAATPAPISGRVIAAAGEQLPIEGAVVRLEGWPSVRFPILTGLPPIATTITGKDGRFLLPSKLAGEDLRITAVAKGFAVGNYRTNLDRLGEEVTILLRPGIAVTGSVVDTAGKPVRGAIVQAVSPLAPEDSQGIEAVSGADGAFQLDGLEPPTKLVAIAPGFLISDSEPIRNAASPVRIEMQPALTKVKVTVEDRLGKPVQGAYIKIIARGPERTDDPMRGVVGRSDAKGLFQTAVLPEGIPEIGAMRTTGIANRNDGMDTGSRLQSGELFSQKITLPTKVTITGTAVDDQTNKAIEGVVLLARNYFSSDRDGPLPLSQQPNLRDGELAVTGPDGKFSLTALTEETEIALYLEPPPGYLRLRDKENVGDTVRASIPPGSNTATPLEIRFQRGIAISGRVISPLGNPEGKGLSINSRTGRMIGSQTDAAGRFRVIALPGKDLRISATSEFAHGVSPGINVPREGKLADVEIRTQLYGSISGHVTWNGRPLSDAAIHCFPKDPEDKASTATYERTDADGFFGFKIRAGTWEVRIQNHASGNNRQPEPRIVTVKPGQDVENVDFAMSAGESIEGIVTDQAGNPIAGASIIRITVTKGDWNGWGQGETNLAGAFSITGLKKGEVIPRLAVEAAGYMRQELSGVVEDGTVKKVTLKKTPSAVLTLRDSEGAPIINCRLKIEEIYAIPGDEGWYPGMRVRGAPKRMQRDDGRLILDQLRTGRYRATFETDGDSSQTLHGMAEFELAEDGPNVALAIEGLPGRELRGRVLWEDTKDPVPGALVVLSEFKMDMLANPEKKDPDRLSYEVTHSDATGGFVIANAPPRNVFLSAQAAMSRSMKPTVLDLATAQASPEILLHIPRPLVLRGRVIGRDAKPVEGVSVQPELMMGNVPKIVTSADGSYSLIAPPAHFSGIKFFAPVQTGLPHEIGLSFQEQDKIPQIPADVVLDFTDAVELSGKIIDNGKPWDAGGGPAFPSFVKVDDGVTTYVSVSASEFRLLLPPGEWALKHGGFGSKLEQRFILPPSPAQQTRTFEFAYGSGKAIFIFPQSANVGVGKTEWRAIGADPATPPPFSYNSGLETYFPVLPAGRYLASFTSQDSKWTGTSAEFTIANGETTNIEIPLKPAPKP